MTNKGSDRQRYGGTVEVNGMAIRAMTLEQVAGAGGPLTHLRAHLNDRGVVDLDRLDANVEGLLWGIAPGVTVVETGLTCEGRPFVLLTDGAARLQFLPIVIQDAISESKA